MKKWKKYTLIVLSVVLVLLILAVAWLWPMVRVLKGTEAITGPIEAVPEVSRKNITPLVSGDHDWPCWRGPRGDGVSTVTGIATDWSGGLNRLWEVNFLCSGSSAATWSAVMGESCWAA